MPESRLEQAQRYVERSREVVERQREFVERLRAKSVDVDDAESILACFQRSLVIFEDELARIEGKSFG